MMHWTLLSLNKNLGVRTSMTALDMAKYPQSHSRIILLLSPIQEGICDKSQVIGEGMELNFVTHRMNL